MARDFIDLSAGKDLLSTRRGIALALAYLLLAPTFIKPLVLWSFARCQVMEQTTFVCSSPFLLVSTPEATFLARSSILRLRF